MLPAQPSHREFPCSEAHLKGNQETIRTRQASQDLDLNRCSSLASVSHGLFSMLGIRRADARGPARCHFIEAVLAEAPETDAIRQVLLD